ncbi:hypothetical protein ACPW7J_09470 [Ihubacter sp. rT4E-8]|uniref:hypothetical protein n=1 Tax=Ihubacter sp. rT4E-8 TaxID=3242369 RepID=UPI003CFADF18
MAKMNIPNPPVLHYTYYNDLLGADFSCDSTECNPKRSPDTLNMTSNNGGNPVKRLGWRTKYSLGENEKIIKLYIDSDFLYAITTAGVYRIANDTVTKLVDKTIEKAELVKFNGKVYVFAGGIYEIGEAFKDVLMDAYVPETIISRKPDGTGGTFLESINLFTPKRKISFLGDTSSKQYNLVPAKDQQEDAYKYIITSSVKVEIQGSDGVFAETTAYILPESETVTGLDVDGTSKTFSVCAPYITFTDAHPPVVTGQDNVRITYEAFDATLENGIMRGVYKKERAELLSTGVVKSHGYIAADRLFCVVGGTRVYYSDVNRPDYFPDDNYLKVGNDGEIKGLHRVGQYLVAIKNEISVESTIYLIEGVQFDGQTVFSVTPAIAGVGAISGNSFATLVDEPLFLARTGIYAISGTYISAEKVVRNRSMLLDKRLCKEADLENAVGVVWNRYYILSVNGHAYVLDGRKKSSERGRNTDYVYEAYYWENVPATCFFTYANELWFGTEDGRICKFNTDVDDITAYCDDGTEIVDNDGKLLMTGGVPIPCKWSTPLDSDGYPQYFKTLNKKGNVLTLLPYDRSSVTISLSKDGNPPMEIGTWQMDIFNWKVIDFSRFTFNSNSSAQDAFLRKKVKKYKRLQVIFENDTIYEPFGIIGYTKTYSIGNFAK